MLTNKTLKSHQTPDIMFHVDLHFITQLFVNEKNIKSPSFKQNANPVTICKYITLFDDKGTRADASAIVKSFNWKQCKCSIYCRENGISDGGDKKRVDHPTVFAKEILLTWLMNKGIKTCLVRTVFYGEYKITVP